MRVNSQLAAQDHRAPGAPGAATVGRQIDHRHQLQLFIEFAGGESRLAIAQCVEILAHALAAPVHAIQAVLDRAVRAEEVGDLIPQALVR